MATARRGTFLNGSESVECVIKTKGKHNTRILLPDKTELLVPSTAVKIIASTDLSSPKRTGPSMTKLRFLYELIDTLSVETQFCLCRDLNKSRKVPPLISWFTQSLETIRHDEKIKAPFLGANQARKRLKADSGGTNRVVYLLRAAGEIHVVGKDDSEDYRFRYVEREISPLRAPGVGRPDSGRGGIDYVARRLSGGKEQPCLGEIKVKADQNAFYAFIQLLTYLSELATQQQVERIQEHTLFGKDVGLSPSFDLHILLADFSREGKRGELTGKTQELATYFKNALRKCEPKLAGLLGSVLCLEMDVSSFEQTKVLNLRWKV